MGIARLQRRLVAAEEAIDRGAPSPRAAAACSPV
jgi:hypothetical protein